MCLVASGTASTNEEMPPWMKGLSLTSKLPGRPLKRQLYHLHPRRGDCLQTGAGSEIGELYSQGKMNPVTITISPDRDRKYVMYLDDDGVTNSAEKERKYRPSQISYEGILK